MNKKHHTLSFFEAVCLIAAIYVICHLLRQDDIFSISINSAWVWFSHLSPHFHVVAVALLPVYVALMIFGTAILAMFLGSRLQRWINQLFCK